MALSGGWLAIDVAGLGWLIAGFIIGLALGLLLAAGRRRLARDLLERQDAARQAETEALLDGVKAAFGEVTDAAMRRTGDDLMRLSQASMGAERRLQGQQLAAERAEFEARINVVLAQLERMQALIRELERDRSSKFGELAARLDVAGHSADALVAQTRQLAAALGNARARGQWGERLAEDVLRAIGMVEHVNYRKQAGIADGARRPDFTFLLPHDLVVHMDVKFPFDNWLRLTEAGDEATRRRHEAAFVRDVRTQIAEVAGRDYVAPADGTLDFAILFVPNEQILAGALELEPGLLDEALGRSVVLASPATLFAILAVIRRGLDAFRLGQAARDLALLMGGFRKAWNDYLAEGERVGRALDEAQAAFHRLQGVRVRQLDRRLDRLDHLGTGAADGGAD